MPGRMIPNLPVTIQLPFSELEEKRPVLLVTSLPAWEAVRGKVSGLQVSARLEPTEATLPAWERLLKSVKSSQAEVVYALGGGLCADAAKYFASRLDMPLTVLPTALSVDAFMTASSAIRQAGCVRYIQTKVPDKLILDLQVVSAAPAAIRAAGITDVLSIATGCWDWKYAHKKEANPPGMEFIPWVYEAAQVILHAVMECAPAAGRGDQEGLKCLFDCLALEVQLCNQIGHARPEEGSEHYFAYCAEQFTGSGWPHGDLVGPGILLMARCQGQDAGQLENALKACEVPLNRIPPDIIQRILKRLPVFCRKHALPFGIAHVPVEVV